MVLATFTMLKPCLKLQNHLHLYDASYLPTGVTPFIKNKINNRTSHTQSIICISVGGHEDGLTYIKLILNVYTRVRYVKMLSIGPICWGRARWKAGVRSVLSHFWTPQHWKQHFAGDSKGSDETWRSWFDGKRQVWLLKCLDRDVNLGVR